MVNDVEVQQSLAETSVVSLAVEDCDDLNLSVEYSHCNAAVNTHSSILDLTEDGEDEENAEMTSFLIEEAPMNESLDYGPPSYTEVHSSPMRHHCCAPLSPPSSEVTVHDTSLLDRFTESFVESLCFRGDKELAKRENHNAWKGAVKMMETDLLELLGCVHPPNADEMEQVWAWNQTVMQRKQQEQHLSPSRPRRHSMRERAVRLHRLRTERTMPQQPLLTSCSPSPSPTSVSILPHRSRSMDDRIFQLMDDQDHTMVQRIGFGMDPILPEGIELGYDSDPEEIHTSDAGDLSFEIVQDSSGSECAESPPKLLPSPMLQQMTTSDDDICAVVQECLNMTWALTWHTKDTSRPVGMHVERGTLVRGSTMLEPLLMWRESYQPMNRHKLNIQPFSVRLLNICRILPLPSTSEHKEHYPLARPSHSILVKTSEPAQEFVFETPTPESRGHIIRLWKLTVARFATLAVMEDYVNIYDEFYATETLGGSMM